LKKENNATKNRLPRKKKFRVPYQNIIVGAAAFAYFFTLQTSQVLATDMCADTILSMTIIAWAFLPVNRNTVPVCVICAPIWCHLLFFFWEELVQRL